MTDETSTPEPKAQIDTIGWVFVAKLPLSRHRGDGRDL